MTLSIWQSKFLRRFDDDLVIALCGISAGKTRVLAIWLILQCLQNKGIRGIIIAQTFRALSLVLVREIENVCAEMNVSVTVNKSAMTIKFPNESILYGFSAENPTAILGLTEISLLAIDEAAYCNEEIYNNARDRMRGSKYGSKVRLISSPNNTVAIANYFSELVKRYPDKIIHASALDNPFTSIEFKNELKQRYIEGSNLYRQQVLGEIFDVDVLTAIVNKRDFVSEKKGADNEYFLGYDASGAGCDKDVVTIIDKYGVVEIVELHDTDTIKKANKIAELYGKYNIINACCDGTGGYSYGVVDVLKLRNIELIPVNFAEKAVNELYNNIRTEMYMNAAKHIKEGFYIPTQFHQELVSVTSEVDSRGRLMLCPKEYVKKIIGHSPDTADSIVLGIQAMQHNIKAEDRAKMIADKYMRYMDL